MLIKRLLSNLIDTALFWLVYFISFIASGLPIEEGNSGFLLFLSFLIVVILPVLFNNSTFGKIIMGLAWQQQETLKIKLFIKYMIYFAAASPSLSVSSALDGLIHGTVGKTASVVFANGLIGISFLVADFFVFLLSLGKYHIVDYLLKISLLGATYKRSPWIYLGMTYLFTTALVSFSAVLIKRDFLPDKLFSHFKSIFYNEQFPSDKFHGRQPLVIKEHTDHVFAPSDPLTFLYASKFKQKTIFLDLPYEIFQSLESRRKICIDLLNHSWTNDIFNQEEPKQVRIVLSSTKAGRFLNYYNYYRVYYYDKEFSGWGIYGGIKTDSTITEKYVSFFNAHRRNKSLVIEKNLKMSMQEILKKIKTDNGLRQRFFGQLSLHFKFSWTTESVTIALDRSTIRFDKIDFDDSPLYGTAQVNFPVSNVMSQFNFANILADRIEDADENLYMLLQVREITNEHLN